MINEAFIDINDSKRTLNNDKSIQSRQNRGPVSI